MKRGRLFVAYHYTGKYHNPAMMDTYQGYNNMVGHALVYAPQNREMLENLQEVAAEHCCATMGFDAAVCTILNWKVMDGD